MKFLTPIDVLTLATDPGSGTAGEVYFNSTDNLLRIHNGTAWTMADEFVLPYTFSGNLSVTTGVLRLYNNTGNPWTIYRSDVYVATAPTGVAATFGIRKNGAAATITLTVAATTNAANSTTKLIVASGDYLTVDISTIGSTVAGANAQLILAVAS